MAFLRKLWPWSGTQAAPVAAKPAAASEQESKPAAPKSSTQATHAALAKKPAVANNAPVTLAHLPAAVSFEDDPQTLVAQQLENLAKVKAKSIERRDVWLAKRAEVVKLGAEGDDQPKEEIHDEKKSLLGALWQAVKDFCKPAEQYIHDQLDSGLGAHISKLHADLKAEIDALNAATDQKQQLAIKLRICNTMIDLNTERQLLADNIKAELESCLKEANEVNIAVILAWSILIKTITTLPVPTPDFQIVQKYERNLGDRIKTVVIAEDEFNAELDGDDEKAFVLLNDSSSPVVADTPDLPASKAKPVAEIAPLRKLSSDVLFNKPAAAGEPGAQPAPEPEKPTVPKMGAL